MEGGELEVEGRVKSAWMKISVGGGEVEEKKSGFQITFGGISWVERGIKGWRGTNCRRFGLLRVGRRFVASKRGCPLLCRTW